MREIKFRAWIKDRAYMVKVLEINLVHRTIVHDKCAESYTPVFFKEGNYVLMQYTGLKDNYGTEIYEGDVLKITSDDEINLFDSNTGIGDVQWYIDCWYVSKVHNGLYDLLSEYEVEVIGNIYQDKNLLEVD